MKEDKLKFIFGFGAVITTSSPIEGTLTFTQIKPPLQYLGKILSSDLDRIKKKKVHSVTFNRKEHGDSLRELRNKLADMKEGAVLEFEGVLLDFTVLEQQSIEVVCRGIDRALSPFIQLALAV